MEIPVPTPKKNTVSGAHVHWNGVPHAATYSLYRSGYLNGTYTLVKSRIKSTNFTDTTAKTVTL